MGNKIAFFLIKKIVFATDWCDVESIVFFIFQNHFIDFVRIKSRSIDYCFGKEFFFFGFDVEDAVLILRYINDFTITGENDSVFDCCISPRQNQFPRIDNASARCIERS